MDGGASYATVHTKNQTRLSDDTCLTIINGDENGNPLQHSCLENPMDRGAYRTTVHGVTKSRTNTHHNKKIILQWTENKVWDKQK